VRVSQNINVINKEKLLAMINALTTVKSHEHRKTVSSFEHKNQNDIDTMKKLNVGGFIVFTLTMIVIFSGIMYRLQSQKVESKKSNDSSVGQNIKSNEQTPDKPQSAPPNDNYANASIITGNYGTIGINTVQAVKDSNEQNHTVNAGGDSVWYRWHSTVSDCALTLTTSGSNFDTTLAVYEYRKNGNVSELLPIAANDDGFPGLNTSSYVTIKVEPNKDYYIAVDGHNDGSGAIASRIGSLSWHINYYNSSGEFASAH
jgi:hypothetical protein